MGKKIVIAGAGHGGLVAGAKLAQAGYDVTVYERKIRSELGYDWEDAIDMRVFAECGLEPPKKEHYAFNGDMKYYNPNLKAPLVVPANGKGSAVFERKEIYDFSDEYYDSTVCAAVKADADYASLDDIKGQTVVVKTGTQSAAWAEEIAEEYELKLVYKDDSAMMYQEVLSGNAAACFEDFPVMAYGVSQDNGLKLLVENQESYATPYGFAVKKGENAELLEKFNAGLKNIKDNGKYQEIVDKYTAAE